MKNLLIKSCILALMIFAGYALATTPPPSGKKKAKKEATCAQHNPEAAQASTSNSTLPNIPSWCQPVNCKPANCGPANCNPANCKPANCNPANCKPANCKPVQCQKAASSCKSAGSLE